MVSLLPGCGEGDAPHTPAQLGAAGARTTSSGKKFENLYWVLLKDLI